MEGGREREEEDGMREGGKEGRREEGKRVQKVHDSKTPRLQKSRRSPNLKRKPYRDLIHIQESR